jgi:tetratricopeptide (TPR) repeat protein
VKHDPGHSLAWERLAYLYLQDDDLEATWAATQQWTEHRHDHHEPWMFGGHVLVKSRRFAEAEERFTQGITRAPDSRRHAALRRRAQVRLCQEKYAEAVRDYSEAIEASGAAVWIYYHRATARWLWDRPGGAVEDYRKFFELDGSSSYAAARMFLALHEQARELEQANRHADARQARDEANNTLETARAGAPAGSWEAKILECLAGERTPQQLADAAGSGRLTHVCEACYYAGEVCLLHGDSDAARQWFRLCVDTDLPLAPGSFPPDPMNEFHLAKGRLKQLSVGDSAAPSPNQK